jgi:hypothetical protein
MDNDHMQHQDREDDQLTRRLEAYAEARLSPELSATIRMRARVMAAAHRHAALARADADRAAAAALIAAEPHADRTRRSQWRRPLTALLAAGLTLGVGVGSVAASQAGGPLYGVRIWAETLTLPSEADARAQAELERLQERLAEAAAATAAGDTNAANAALEAYAAIVNEATEGAGNDVSAAATLETGVRSNIDVLEVLVDRVPTDAARDAIQRAIDRSDSAIDEMTGKPNGTPPAADPTRSPKPDKTDQPDKTANPNRPTDVPAAATEKPRPTQKADPTTNAAATPEPDRTPRGGPPSAPPGGGGGGGAPQGSNEAD